MIVRSLTPDDILHNLSEESLSEAASHLLATGFGVVDWGWFRRYWHAILSAGSGFAVGAEGKDGRIEGLLCAVVVPEQFTGLSVGRVVVWHVDPRRRGSLGGRLLIAAEAEAGRLGLSSLGVTVGPSEKAALVCKSLLGRGFSTMEVTMIRQLDRMPQLDDTVKECARSNQDRALPNGDL